MAFAISQAFGFKVGLFSICLTGLTKFVSGHGLVSEPYSRAWFCGYITKPDEIGRGVAEYPECGDAFYNQAGIDPNSGYNFMSILNHHLGRRAIKDTEYICGFDSEFWGNGKTPWDTWGVNWPTTTIDLDDLGDPRGLRLQWDISWGPHFSDSQDFVYYITKDDFVYDMNRKLEWSDFEDEPFCELMYDDSDPTGNPMVEKGSPAIFNTYCDVPQRSGRHIIYAEWGRNPWTYERFHSCVDLEIVGGAPSPPVPAPVPAPAPAPVPAPVPAPIPGGPAPIPAPVPAFSGDNNGIPVPCCGWNGMCEQPDNAWCHASCDQCTGACNGEWYTGATGTAGSGDCSAGPAPAPGPGPAPTPEETGGGCCTWGGWSTCPEWTQTSNDSCQTSSSGCASCSGTWISGRRMLRGVEADSS